MRPRNLYALATILLLGWTQSRAYSDEWLAELDPIPNVISGTLVPLSIAVNGTIVLERAEGANALFVNAKKLDVTESDPTLPFYFTTNDNTLSFAVSSKGKRLLYLKLPGLGEVSIAPSEDYIVLRVSSDATKITVDDERVKISKQRARVPLRDDVRWRKAMHMVRVGAKDAGTRLYNLILSQRVPAPKPKTLVKEKQKPAPIRETESVTATAPESIAATTPALVHWASFEAGFVAVTQKREGQGMSVRVAWTPSLLLSPSFTLVPSFGTTIFKKVWRGTLTVLQMELLLAYTKEDLCVELGAGAHDWLGFGGIRPVAGFNFGWKPSAILPSYVDYMLLGYTALFDANFAHYAKLGMRLRF